MSSAGFFDCWLLLMLGVGLMAAPSLSRQHHADECPSSDHRGPERCRPLAQCSAWYPMLSEASLCSTTDSLWQACCPSTDHVSNRMGMMEEEPLEKELQTVAKDEMKAVAAHGAQALARQAHEEERLVEHRAFLSSSSSSSSSSGYYVNTRATAEAAKAGEQGLMMTRAVQKMKARMHLSNEAAGIATQTIPIKGTALEDTCQEEPVCPDLKYRTLDGSCNNLQSPNMGRSVTQLGRYLAPQYDDGVWQARDEGMPNSRQVRVLLSDTDDAYQPHTTTMLMQYGQFVDHDVTHVPVYQLADSTGVDCCTADGKHLPPELRHEHCFTLDVLPGDSFYGRFGVECINFVRSMVAPRSDCMFGYAEQLSQVTHWHDASTVYGNTKAMSDLLREHRGGRLKTLNMDGRQMLPLDPNNKECLGYKQGLRCFMTGDSRANQHIALTAVHTLFLREHNKLADELSYLNAHWDDDKTFHEARRVLIAQIQHVTHNEYLPIVLGPAIVEAYGLLPRTSGYDLSYSANVTATIFNEFATAAYRYGHSMVPHWFDLLDDHGRLFDRIHLSSHFNDPHPLLDGPVLDGVLRGLVGTMPMDSDGRFTKEIANELFKTRTAKYGGDLPAANTWRGRDHGMPGYTHYRELFKLSKVEHFSDLLDTFTPQVVSRLAQLYKKPGDVDLYLAGMLERRLAGSLLGHTFTHMVADQFARLKAGDRYYYESGGQTSSFTLPQLDEIRRTSMAALLCRNGDDIRHIQPLTFRPVSAVNPRVPCSAIPQISLQLWKEARDHY